MSIPAAGTRDGAAIILLTLAGKDHATTLRIARDARLYTPLTSLLQSTNGAYAAGSRSSCSGG
jgi:hypothetical protein